MESRQFTFIHCSAYGIKDTRFNILRYGQTVGYIDEKHLIGFIHGSNLHFRPIENWKNVLGINLQKELDLSITPKS